MENFPWFRNTPHVATSNVVTTTKLQTSESALCRFTVNCAIRDSEIGAFTPLSPTTNDMSPRGREKRAHRGAHGTCNPLWQTHHFNARWWSSIGGCGPKGACTGFTYLPLSRLGDTVRSRCASLNRVTVIDPRHVARGGRFPGVMRLALSHGLACSARTRSLFSVAAGYYAA